MRSGEDRREFIPGSRAGHDCLHQADRREALPAFAVIPPEPPVPGSQAAKACFRENRLSLPAFLLASPACLEYRLAALFAD